jgi:hypothetical protein
MANPLQDVCDQLAAVVATVEGIRQASGTPPEQMSVFPFVDVYVASGDWTPVPMGSVTGMLRVNIDLHLARKDQMREATISNQLQYAIVIALYKALKAGTVPALQTINHIPVALSVWGSQTEGNWTVGYQFSAEVKVQGVIQ